MNTNIDICTEYKIVGNKLVSENLELQICQRKKFSPTKPLDFILLLDKQTNKKQYLSSLYLKGCRESLCKYKLDYKGKNYWLFMNSDYARIYKMGVDV